MLPSDHRSILISVEGCSIGLPEFSGKQMLVGQIGCPNLHYYNLPQGMGYD